MNVKKSEKNEEKDKDKQYAKKLKNTHLQNEGRKVPEKTSTKKQ